MSSERDPGDDRSPDRRNERGRRPDRPSSRGRSGNDGTADRGGKGRPQRGGSRGNDAKRRGESRKENGKGRYPKRDDTGGPKRRDVGRPGDGSKRSGTKRDDTGAGSKSRGGGRSTGREGTKPSRPTGLSRRRDDTRRGESTASRSDRFGTGEPRRGREAKPQRRTTEREAQDARGRRGERTSGRSSGGRTDRSDDASARPGGRRPAGRKSGDGRAKATRDVPAVPDDVTGAELDAVAREDLKSLPKELATRISRHLVMVGRLLDDDPETAYRHAMEARRAASRVGVVREASGFAAYRLGDWAQALAELRAARRLSGGEAYLAVMADCERGLGRPERALDVARSPQMRGLDAAERVEVRIVESGARRDLGQYDAAVIALQIPELREKRLRPWSVRLFYAYADALAEAGREEESRDWFARAAAADRDGETDAAERYAELDGLDIVDTEEPDTEE